MSFFNGDTMITSNQGLVLSNLSSDATLDSGFGSLYINGGSLKFKIGSEDDVTITSGGALTNLTDLKINDTNFTNSFLIQTNSDGSAPTTGTLNSANNNIGIGKDIFKALTSGTDNIVIGDNLGEKITTGSNNICIGKLAGRDLTTGSNNIIFGHNVVKIITTGSDNIVIGDSNSANSLKTGNNNIIIGDNCSISTNSSSYNTSNQIIIGTGTGNGFESIVDLTGSDTNPHLNTIAYFGKPSLQNKFYASADGAAIIRAAGINESSDRRIKENINNICIGLNFINTIKPVIYNKRQLSNYDNSLKFKTQWYIKKEKPRILNTKQKNKSNIGFIAQEIKQELNNNNINSNNNIVTVNEIDTFHTLDYSNFIPIIIKGVQELNDIITNQERQLKDLLLI